MCYLAVRPWKLPLGTLRDLLLGYSSSETATWYFGGCAAWPFVLANCHLALWSLADVLLGHSSSETARSSSVVSLGIPCSRRWEGDLVQ